MSRNNDDTALLRALDAEGGQVAFGRLAMNGFMAASRLIRKQLAWTGKEAEGGWALVLAPSRQRDPQDMPGRRSHRI